MPGPFEHRRPGRSSWVRHRYVYDGQRLAQRETYRNASASGAEVTRFLPAVPDGPGPMIYWDSDGRVDVNFRDRTGRPWFAYRAREGRPGYPPWAGMSAYTACRHSGFLRPPAIPSGPYLQYPPFALRVLEPDYLLGRGGWPDGTACPTTPASCGRSPSPSQCPMCREFPGRTLPYGSGRWPSAGPWWLWAAGAS